MRSEDTDDTPESTERSGGPSTPRRKAVDKDKEKDPPPSRVRVTVRVRPEVSEREQGTGHLLCQGGRLWLVEGGGSKDGGDGGGGGMASPRGNKESTRQFVFDSALPPPTTQEEVFTATCLETGVLKGITEGFNGCVMCYGQTGAGKTHTLGNAAPGQEGIVPRALRYLLGEDGADGAGADGAGGLAEAAGGRPTRRTISLSMVQIYMETLHDLIAPENSVELREAADGVVLAGAESARVESYEQALALIEAANRNRVTTATSMNDSSSRSHSVLVLDVQTKREARLYQAKLHLVDLAGSERVKKSEVTGQAFDEACFINNSLTCLGRCVQALAAAGQKGAPKPPFRETKLTRLLSGAFGGRANTALCVCVAPSSSDAFETLNSLQFGQQAMSVKVQAKANAMVDYAALEERLFWQVYELRAAGALAEVEAWRRVRPRYTAQEGLRQAISQEHERTEGLREEIAQEGERLEAARAQREATLKQARREHEASMAGLKRQQVASRKELARLRAAAERAGGAPAAAEEGGAPSVAASAAGAAPGGAADDAPGAEAEAEAEAEAARFGAAFLQKHRAAAAQPAASEGEEAELAELEERAEGYQNAVERAWAEVQRMEDARQQMDARFEATREEAANLDREKEEMEATLHEVAADLGRLALLYRSQGKAQHAVPLYMTALAIYEKTLGPEHPEVAKDLVNLGNAFCDQDQHSEAVPLYLRALAIDQAALGDDHPEVAMDLSNLGIVYRVQGRPDEATALFQRAHAIMLAALGPDDPKTQTVARNLASTQVIDVAVAESPSCAPPAGLERRLSTPRAGKTQPQLDASQRAAEHKREAQLQARVEKAADSALPPAQRTPRSAHAPPRAPGSEPPPVAPPIAPLQLKSRAAADAADSASAGCATPRSTYSRASHEAQAAAADSRASGSGHSMLHSYVQQNT